MSKFTVIAEYPAYKVLNGKEKNYFVPGDKIMIGLQTFIFGDVMTSALEWGMCPIESYKEAIERGHEIYYLINPGAMITSDDHKQETVFGLEFGDEIKYAGKRFTVVKQANNNAGLVEIV